MTDGSFQVRIPDASAYWMEMVKCRHACPVHTAREVEHFRIVASPEPGGTADAFPMTFLSPAQRKSP